MTLIEHNDSIRSREGFVSFVKALTKDLRDNPTAWENASLEHFLEALGAWVEDMDGYYANHNKPVPQQPNWRLVADMMLAAKMYE